MIRATLEGLNVWLVLGYSLVCLLLGMAVGFIYEGTKSGGTLDLATEVALLKNDIDLLELNIDRLSHGYVNGVRRTQAQRSVSPDSPPLAGDAA